MSEEEELAVQPELGASSALNMFMLVRLLIWSGVVAVALKFLVKFVLETRRKIELIDKIPGPKSFNPLLGNIPLDIVKYVGADYEASKDMYLSEFQFFTIFCQSDQSIRLSRATFFREMRSSTTKSNYDLLCPFY